MPDPPSVRPLRVAPTRRLRRAALVALLAAAGAASAAPGRDAERQPPGPAAEAVSGDGLHLVPIASYEATREGELVVDARFWETTTGRPVLVLRPGPDGPWIAVVPARRRQVRLSPERVRLEGDGSLRLAVERELLGAPDGPEDLVGMPYEIVDGRLRLAGEEGGAAPFVLGPRRPMLGRFSPAELAEIHPGYAYAARQWEPRSEPLAQLRASGVAAEVRIYFGSWCPRCAALAPRALRLALDLEGTPLEIHFYGLPQEREDAPDSFWRQARRDRIRRDRPPRLPAAYVRIDGREVGTIEDEEWSDPAGRLLEILAAR